MSQSSTNHASGSDSAVLLDGVTKQFGSHVAVSDLTLEIPRGSIYGLLGPNGSGKTTTLRMIMGILRPDRGNVTLLGESSDTARGRVGYLPEERGVYKKMKVIEQLEFLGEIRGMTRAIARKRATAWLERLGLPEWAPKRIEDLSKGMQQKVQFIGTVIHDPELLILDEPFSGLDPINQDVLEDIVRDFHARGTTIVFSTHLMEQAERLCESVCLISKAEKVLDGDLREIKRRERSGAVAVDYEGDDAWLGGPDVEAVEPMAAGVRVRLRDGADPQALLRAALNAGVQIRRFEIVEPTLHEVFVRHVGDEAAAEAGLPAGYEGLGGAA
ncbi:MAG TPA: ATP-binding cassette domain-containing protein [Gemmatimonadetes bacterium]|nr:ATP-binding cassette domain-containing protein [Gemmatimonadota bacterium]